MKTCIGCKNAKWKTTKAGRLHPDGSGRCQVEYKAPTLPSCMYWINGAPRPCGGFIDRRSELKDHCPYYNSTP